MNGSDMNNQRQLALLVELARPLTHECNNFLNNLLLQLAISEKSFPEPARAEWANIRREGKKLANLFQQWQRHRRQSFEVPSSIDLNQLVAETVEELRSESSAAQFLIQATDEPIWLTGSAGEVQRLLSLLLRYGVAELQGGGVEAPAIALQLERSHDRVLLCLREASTADATLCWADFDELASSDRTALSLTALTCKSLVDRLDGTIRLEKDVQGRLVLTIDFPQTARQV